MRTKEQIIKELSEFYFGDEARNYDSMRNSSPTAKKLIGLQKKALRRLLKNIRGKKILDVACGTGFFFSEYGKNKIYGIDISEEMLKIAKKIKNPHVVSLKKADATRIPFEDGFFDVVITSKFIMHTPDYMNVFGEMARVTKKRGIIIADLPNKYSISYIFTGLRIESGKIRYYNFFSNQEIRNICSSFGLSVVGREGTTVLSHRPLPESMFPIIDNINKIKPVINKFSYVYYTKFRKL